MKPDNDLAQPRTFLFALVALSAGLGLAGCSGEDEEITTPQDDVAPIVADASGISMPDPSSEEAVYRDRFERMITAFQTGQPLTTIYDNLATVDGADTPAGLPVSYGDVLKPDIRSAVIDYAGERNTSALMVVRNGVLILEEYFGDFDRVSQLNSKSLAKPLGVIAVGRAIKEGYIRSLSQPASDFLTEWKGTPKEAITIRQLLGMRSGLHHQANDPSPDHVMNRAYLHPRHAKIIINEYPLLHNPGARYDYSNANAELIAPILERATGQTYACLLYTSPSPRDQRGSRMPSSA